MRKYCFKRLQTLIPTLFLISIILFALVKMMPTDPVAMMMDPNTRPELYAASYEAKKEELGFNDSLPIQYFNYMKHFMTGDLGYSSTYQKPVKDVIGEPIKNTILMNVVVLILSFLISLYLGIKCALHPGGFLDRIVQYGSIVGISIPSFLLGISILFIFSLTLHLFPIGNAYDTSFFGNITAMIMPVITLTILSICGLVRYVRNAMLDAMHQDYMLGLKSRGTPKKRMIYVHALRNAMLPIAGIVLLQIPNILSGSLLVEIIFSYNGIGMVMMKALLMRDGYLILTMNLLYALLYIGSSFVLDLTSAYLDPRIRLDTDHEAS